MSVEDQKVNFNLFEAMKHPIFTKTCFRVETIEQAKHAVQQFTIHSPLEKALMNAIECLLNKEEKDLRACLEDLVRLKEIPSGEYAFEELKKDTPTKKHKVELKVLPSHLKYIFLEAVCKEVLKLLEVGLIYPISDSAWVSSN